MYSLIVFKDGILSHGKKIYILGKICLYFGGFLGEAELILRTWGAKENTFRELRKFLSLIWADQCIIFKDQVSKDPPGRPGGSKISRVFAVFKKMTKFAICMEARVTCTWCSMR